MKNLSIIATLFATAATSLVSAQSLAITGVVSETKGTTADIAGSGSADNTTTYNNGTVGVFQMNNGAAYMRVTASNNTGSLVTGRDALMVARTTNSQGLTDDGTLSVYVRNVNNLGNVVNTPWTLDLNFSFYTDNTLSTPLTTNLLLTSLDIDFNQKYYTSNTSFTSNVTSAGTNLTSASAVAGYTGFTNSGDSTFNNPNAAVASFGNGNTFDIRLAHNNIALFMFEFRNPSSVTGLVPEPSSALLALTGISALSLMRRRKGNA